jgi:hypothetical protein
MNIGERQAEKQLKAQLLDLETRRQSLKQEILDAATVAEGYRHLPVLLDAVQQKGSRADLRDVIQRVVDVVEWRQDPNDSKQGKALIRLFPLAVPEGVNRDGSGSTTCPDWLPVYHRLGIVDEKSGAYASERVTICTSPLSGLLISLRHSAA